VCVCMHICPLLTSYRPDVCKGKEETSIAWEPSPGLGDL